MRLPLGQNILMLVIFLLVAGTPLSAQLRTAGSTCSRARVQMFHMTARPPCKNTGGKDSLQKRTFADSITIFYRYFDSTRVRTIDSSINDFTARFPYPYYHNLGNMPLPPNPIFIPDETRF